MVRIISGYFKGRRLKTNTNPHLRPTTDRVKETLFNILGNIEDLRVIDLFAGCGNLGFEALSRGAATCTMVEKNGYQIELLRQNAQILNVEEITDIRRMDVMSFLTDPPEADLVLADPPYAFTAFEKLFKGLAKGFSNAVIGLESSIGLDVPESFRKTIKTQRTIGKTLLTIMKV